MVFQSSILEENPPPQKKAFSYLQLGMERKMCFQCENWLTILQIKCSALDELDEYNKLLSRNILNFI